MTGARKFRTINKLNEIRALFLTELKFIREEEIPDYLKRTDIPPPGQKPVFIHHISPPFIYQNKSALMYSRRWSSGANIKVRSH